MVLEPAWRAQLDLHQDSDNARHRVGDGNLARAEQGNVDPTHLARGESWERGGEIGRHCEPHRDDLVDVEPISFQDRLEELTGSVVDVARIVLFDTGRTTDSMGASPQP